MEQLLSALPRLSEFQQLCAALDNGVSPAAVSGLSPIHRAYFAAALRRQSGRPVVLLCADEGECQRLAGDLRALTGEEVWTLPGREFTFHNAAVVSRQWEHLRLKTFWALSQGEVPFLAAPAEALLQRTMPRELLEQAGRTLTMGQRYDLGELAEALTAAGYSRCDQVEGVGQFALRGGILDFFSPAHPLPVRMEFFGDDVDSMGLFDISSQRRVEQLEECRILPAAEVLPQFAPRGDGGPGPGPGSAAGRRGQKGRLPRPAAGDPGPGQGAAGKRPLLPRHRPVSGPYLSQDGHGGGLSAPGRRRPYQRQSPVYGTV